MLSREVKEVKQKCEEGLFFYMFTYFSQDNVLSTCVGVRLHTQVAAHTHTHTTSVGKEKSRQDMTLMHT